MDIKNFIASGRTIVSDTMAPKTQPVKASKGVKTESSIDDPTAILIKRCKSEHLKKSEVIDEFKKIIEREEAKI